MLLGHCDGDPVLLVRKEKRVLALGARCTHYGGPLAEGVFDGELVRCPWHHACFRAETGEAVRAPAFDPVPSYAVEVRGGRVFVTGKRPANARASSARVSPSSVVVVGGGAAGLWRRIEAAVCHAFHRHLLGAMRREVEPRRSAARLVG